MSTVSSVEAIEALARRLHEPLGELFGAATCADACWEQEGIVHRVTVQVRMNTLPSCVCGVGHAWSDGASCTVVQLQRLWALSLLAEHVVLFLWLGVRAIEPVRSPLAAHPAIYVALHPPCSRISARLSLVTRHSSSLLMCVCTHTCTHSGHIHTP